MIKVRLKTLTGDEYSVNEDRKPVECFRCGICCMGYYPQLDDEEISRISGSMEITPEEFISKYIIHTQIGYLLRQTKKGCIFLTWENGTKSACRIHPFRPDACRNWEATLYRRECKAGLLKIQEDGRIMTADKVYDTQAQLERFYASLK